MVNFLDKIISVLPESQKIAIKSLIASKVAFGELTSIRSKQEEANTIYNRIKSKLDKVLLSPRYAVKDQKISSMEHNQNMEEIYLDLNSLYSAINDLYGVSSKQGISLDSDYQKSRASIEKIINDVKVYSLRKQHPEFNDIKLIDFNSSSNQSRKNPTAEVNPNTRLLQLKPLLISRTHLPIRTTRETKVYTKTFGQGLKGELSTSFPPENMVDQKPETFWASIVLADSPISQKYELNSNTDSSYQVSVDGPVVEVYFKFSHVEKINTIKILPFSEYPIKIINIAYTPTPSSQVYITIDDFSPSTTLDWEEYNFSPVYASSVKITIAQENYKKSSYLLPKSVVVNTDIFQRILREKASKIVGNAILDSDFSLYLVSSISNYNSALTSLETMFKDSGVDITIQPSISYFDDFSSLIKKVYEEISPDNISSIATRLSSNTSNQQPDNKPVNINKYEYLLGIREVEINYQLYYPSSYYESEKYIPKATVSEIQIEVDELHTFIPTQWQDDYRKTSTEWEVDIGEGRKVPIHPVNIVDSSDDIPAVNDERINFDLSTNKAYTRLGSYYSTPYRLKKNSDLVPSDYYSSIRVTGAIPRMEITLTGEWFDPKSIYTVDYAVDPSSYTLSVLDKFNSQPVPSPEIFTKVGSDNEIELSKFPFINYEIINLTGFFSKDQDKSLWKFVPPQKDIFSGQLVITPTIIDSAGNISQSGSVTASLVTGVWGLQSGVSPHVLSGNPSLSLSYFGEISSVQFGYYLKVMNSSKLAELSRFNSSTGFTLLSPIEVTEDQVRSWDSYAAGYVFSGSLTSPISGSLTVDYTIGAGVKTDGQIYAISNTIYNPITVTVGNREAKNITNYETLIHPAFSVPSVGDRQIEYIQAGKKIYFNQKIDTQEIIVYYNWLTEYIKVFGRLKFNGPTNPNLTPKVNEIRVFCNNLVI